MSQSNTNTNNGHNRNSGRGGRGQGTPNGSGRGHRHNNRGNKSIAKYSFKGKMKDSLISDLTITETGHRPSQFKKISDALPVFCANKNYQGLDEVLRTGRDLVEALVVFICAKYRKSITNLFELRGSMPCFGNC